MSELKINPNYKHESKNNIWKQFSKKKKKKKKTVILIISLLIITSLLASGGFLIIKNNSKTKNAANNQPTKKEKESTPPKDNPPSDQPSEEENNCPYLTEANLTTASTPKLKKLKMLLERDEAELSLWKKIPHSFIVENWKKGYHWHDILQLWEWKISLSNIPNLKSEQRIGVINSLHYYFPGLPASILLDKSISKEEKKKMLDDDSVSGVVKNLVIIIRKLPPGEPSINLDKNIQSGTARGDNTQKYVRNLITHFCQSAGIDFNQYQISFLNCLGVEYFNKEADIKNGLGMGKSIGSTIYLALLSAWKQKPIARSVATTGWVTVKKKKGQFKNQNIDLNLGTNLPIGGIKGKTIGAAKRGINRLVLSKFQTSPFISLWDKQKGEWFKLDKDDYSAVVPADIQAKIKEVHWTENIQELKELILEGKLS